MPAITALTVSAATPVARALAIVAARTSRALKQLAEKVKNRHDAMRLAELDDRMLADIGLTRGDLRDAYSEPVWRDPTAILVSRAHERRINRRRRRVSIGLSEKAFEAPSIVPGAKAPTMPAAWRAD